MRQFKGISTMAKSVNLDNNPIAKNLARDPIDGTLPWRHTNLLAWVEAMMPSNVAR